MAAVVLHNTQPAVKSKVASDVQEPSAPVAFCLREDGAGLMSSMGRPKKIHIDKQPKRFHYIAEWADRRQKQQVDIVEHLGVNKGTVSRWFSGTIPTEQYLLALADFLELEEPADLFRHPDDDWMSRLLKGRTSEDIDRILQMIDLAFPRKTSAA